ncbi:helix-turn-helix transcriptional regulator [Paenibacillus eucommiae]|uniref:ArsR family transcriptional regulator n=1 Tax=Paenibacillus eucommiae TaxID=1355755 RepID=A0ABS4IQS0_9BACL|nr:metalloregulator ArsR/SmtB family transcription factor [Paenibacillus eucommiae]MBP1989922.1 putative ArsR family transcriptional regulator [Paenibacillus eucommiae]
MKKDSGLSTREQIVQMLKTNGELSTKDLTEQLGITGMAVRRHIDALERDGLIESRTLRQPMGRPTAIYSLTEEADRHFPKKYHAIALDLLGELAKEAGESQVNHLFDMRKETLYNKYSGSMDHKNLAEKVSTLADIQNENGYMVEWQQKNENEFILEEHNCPISKIANKYNHACQCELGLFENLLDADITRTECLAKGGKKCVYLIRKRNEQQ